MSPGMLDEPVPLRTFHGTAPRHASFLFDLSAALVKSDAPRVLAAAVVSAAAGSFCDACVAYLKDEPRPLIRLALAGGGDETQALLEKTFDTVASTDGFLAEAMRGGQTFRFHRGASRVSFIEETAARALHATGMGSMIVVPLTIGSNSLGALTFLNRGDDAYDEVDVCCAVTAARQLTLAMENAILRERERRVEVRTRLLAEATDRLFSTSNELEMLHRLADVVVAQFADWVFAASVSDGKLVPIATVSPLGDDESLKDFRDEHIFGPGGDAIMEAIRAQRPLLGSGRASWMMAPLFAGGLEYGAVFCYSRAHAYDVEDLDMLRELCRRASLALEYANSFARQRRLAQSLQRAALPPNLTHVPGARVDVVYQPAALEEQVGGDWYDLFPLGEGRVLATIGDVTGHGLPAWAIMMKLRHSLNVVAKYEADPARILDVVEEIVAQRYPEALATAFAAIIDTRQQTMTYANAGHPAPMLRRHDGTVEACKTYGLPIGLRHLGPAGKCETASLADAALLVFYTDGLIESTKNAIEGERWLIRSLTGDAARVTADSANFIKSYCLRGPAPDDVAVLTLNFVSMPRWSFSSSDRQAAKAARDEFCELLAAAGLSSEDCAACELIFGELVGNVARHAAGQVEVALDVGNERAILHVLDRGPGYRIARLVAADVLEEGGRGLWLARKLGRSLEVEPIPGFGTHTSAELPGTISAFAYS